MSDPREIGEGTVSGDQVTIPAHVRRRFDVEDGDVVRWKVVEEKLVAEFEPRTDEVFDDFEPGASDEPVDAVEDHDAFGIE